MGLRAAYKWYGEKLYTAIVSNLAVIHLPKSMTRHVKAVSCLMGATDLLPIKMTACTYNGKLDIAFMRCIEEADIIKEFFRFLTKDHSIKIEIYGNGWREDA